MRKRLVSIFIAVVMVLGMMPVIASAASSGTCGDNLTWTLDDEGTLTIDGTGAMDDYGYFDSPFYDNKNIKAVIIHEGVTSIPQDAFSGCTNLINITLPRSINEINYQAFRNCGIEDVYYAGSKSEWNGIYIEDGNESIKNANKHYGRLDYINVEITKEETDTAYTFTVTLETAYENCFVYAAIYDADGVLLGVNRVPLQMTGSTSVSVDKQENGTTAKVFVWSDFMQSIIEQAGEFPLT